MDEILKPSAIGAIGAISAISAIDAISARRAAMEQGRFRRGLCLR